MKVVAFVVLLAVSAAIGMAIGAGENRDPRVGVPIPIPIEN